MTQNQLNDILDELIKSNTFLDLVQKQDWDGVWEFFDTKEFESILHKLNFVLQEPELSKVYHNFINLCEEVGVPTDKAYDNMIRDIYY